MKTSRRKGLVLIELLTVLFIISSIIMIMIPNFRYSVAKVNATACQANLKNISSALQFYSNDNDNVFPDSLDRLTPDYLKYIPTCQSAGVDTYTAGYEVVPDQSTYTAHCHGLNHTKVKFKRDEPYYSFEEGLKP